MATLKDWFDQQAVRAVEVSQFPPLVKRLQPAEMNAWSIAVLLAALTAQVQYGGARSAPVLSQLADVITNNLPPETHAAWKRVWGALKESMGKEEA